MKISFAEVKANSKIAGFISQTEKYLDALGYTDHGFRHAEIVAERGRYLAEKIGLSQKDQELAAIAGYCHDMANFLGREQHHYWAAIFFSQIFLPKVEQSEKIAEIMQAIVTHDKNSLKIVNKISAILVLADKSDVHRDRAKNSSQKNLKTDIHERVNYSVTKNIFRVDRRRRKIILKLKIDPKVTDPLEYFEIFVDRMVFCRLAAEYLKYKFVLIINDFKLSS